MNHRVEKDHRPARAVCLIFDTAPNSNTVAAVESASSHNGGSSPSLRPLTASTTASEPKDNQIAIPAPTAVRTIGTENPRTRNLNL